MSFVASLSFVATLAAFALGCNTRTASSSTVSVETKDAVLGVHTLTMPDGSPLGVAASPYSTILRGEVTALASDVILHQLTVEVSQTVKSMEVFGYDGSTVATNATPGKVFVLKGKTGGLVRIPGKNESQDFFIRADAEHLTADTTIEVKVTEMVISSAKNPTRLVVSTDISTKVRLEVPPKPRMHATSTAIQHLGWGTDDLLAEIVITETSLAPSKLGDLVVYFGQTTQVPLNLRLVDENGVILATGTKSSWSETTAYLQFDGGLRLEPGKPRVLRLLADTLNSLWVGNTLEVRFEGIQANSEVNSQVGWSSDRATVVNKF